MKRLIGLITAALLLVACPLLGQTPKIDSLKKVLKDLPRDTTRLQVLLDLSENLYRFNQDSAIYYGQLTKELSDELGKPEARAYALKYIGAAYYFKSDFPEVLANWEKSLEVFQSLSDNVGISNMLSNIGAVYYSKGDDPKALENYFESLRYAGRIDDTDTRQRREATAFVNIGAVYSNDEKTYDKSLENLTSALAIMEDLQDQSGIGTVALNLGEVYMAKEEYDQALLYFNKALDALRKAGGHLPTALNLTGRTYTEMGEYDKAIEYFKEGFATASASDAKIEMAQSLVYKSQLYLEQKEYYDAIRVSNEAMVIAEEIDAKKELRTIYDVLSEAHAGVGNFEKAYENHVKLNEIQDVIEDEEYVEKIGNLRFQFEVEKKDDQIALLNADNELKEARLESNRILRNFMYIVGVLLLFIIGGISYQYFYMKKSRNIIAEERNKSREILLNILPQETADELSEKGYVEAKKFEETTVLFTDFKSFTSYAEKTPAEELVKSLDFYFRKFDEITSRHNLEKIKTIGDAYMCAGGLPIPNDSHAEDAVRAALEMVTFVNEQLENPTPGIHSFETRIGINTGSVVAGVVGTKKFQYDIWGNTVNIASRMESGSEPGKINISENIYEKIKDKFICTYRGEFEVKNAGKQKMYFVEGVREQMTEKESVEVA